MLFAEGKLQKTEADVALKTAAINVQNILKILLFFFKDASAGKEPTDEKDELGMQPSHNLWK